MRSCFFLSALLFAPAVCGQTPTYVYSPAGADVVPGTGGTQLPFSALSATYQQIHDFADMNQIAFRPAFSNTLTGRSWDVQINVGNTKVSSQQITTTFSTNLGLAKRVVGNQQTPFQKISFSTVSGSTNLPNPVGVIVPFAVSNVYVPVKGTHFCWEWRHKNASSTKAMLVDTVQATTSRGVILPSVGAGCSGAKASSSFIISRTSSSYKASLTNVPASTKALMMVGVQQKQTLLPGWCTNLEMVPLLHLFGNADGSGRWDYVAPMTVFKNIPSFKMLTQYAFLDGRQPFRVGLSDMAVYQTPLSGAYNISRAYKGTAGGTVQGDETATTATGTALSFGLILGIQL